MESSRYWQIFSKEGLDALSDSYQVRRKTAAAAFGRDQEPVIYGGKALSLEDYLAVPTFVRRGLAIGG